MLVTAMDINVTLDNIKKKSKIINFGNLEARLNLNRSWT